MATFPSGIKSWSKRINNVNDVDASDFNQLADEVTAIQTVLGITPADDLTLNGVRTRFVTVADRIAAMARGTQNPFVRLDSAAEDISNNTVTTINFDTPNAIDNPNSLFDGIGWTVKRSGYYVLTTDIRWPKNYVGYRYIGLMVNSTEVAADSRSADLPGASTAQMRQSVSWQGRLTKGQKITTRVNQNSGVKLNDASVTLSGSFQRDLPA